ncbi:MAG: hypothetical protein BAJATHORv1_20540 [Candidatus Thorarchaeota archaeon]|nr:MAG: hypothetical protein BAJATHORv1_20540 [Candidatus Thorarchaeota archaeon]
MARTKNTIVSVKVPINWDLMTKRKRSRLDRITSRDTRVIRVYLGIIMRHEKELLVGKKKKRINAGSLDKLTLTALRFRDPAKCRIHVEHDLKARFQNISQNELQECRDIAIAMWNSYLERGGSPPLHSTNMVPRKIPRNIFQGRFKLIHRQNSHIRYWLELRDSLDSVRQEKKIHDKLVIPLKMSPFHENQLSLGKAKSCRIVKDSRHKWWVVFAVSIPEQKETCSNPSEKPLAVLGIDLGISKAACTVLLKKDKSVRVRYFKSEKHRYIRKHDRRISSLQSEMNRRKNLGLPYDKVVKKLRDLKHKRAAVRDEWDKVLVSELVSYASELSTKYNLYVTIGNPKGIRNIALRGYSSSRTYRGMIHSWSFARIILNLEHQFSIMGWSTGKPGDRFLAVFEGRTSITCHQCGRKGIRPKQSLFVCHTCGYRDNADKNGAINIARRMILLTPALRVKDQGLECWLLPRELTRSKAARRTRSSKRKSKLPQGSSASSKRESAVVRSVQTELLSFGDSTKMNDEDPAVENAAETSSASVTLDSPRSDGHSLFVQRTEATFQQRGRASTKLDKAHVTPPGANQSEFSDDRHGSGRTQELVGDGIHSSDSDMLSM